jgi:hypothetical protein
MGTTLLADNFSDDPQIKWHDGGNNPAFALVYLL